MRTVRTAHQCGSAVETSALIPTSSRAGFGSDAGSAGDPDGVGAARGRGPRAKHKARQGPRKASGPLDGSHGPGRPVDVTDGASCRDGPEGIVPDVSGRGRADCRL